MSPWGWSPGRSLGIWRHGAVWLKPACAAVPFLTVGLLLVHLRFVSGVLSVSEGTLFDLPDAAPTDAVSDESPVALMMSMPRETLVFFDDTRYLMGEDASMRALGEQLSNRFSRREEKTLLVLADRRVACGEMMRLAALAKANGVARILFADKRTGAGGDE